MPRFHLPVLVERRTVLRGLAATLLASLCGSACSTDFRPPSEPDSDGDGEPDGDPVGDPDDPSTPTTPTPPPPPAPTTGFSQCGNEICLDLADPANTVLRTVDGARVITVNGVRLLVIRIDVDQFLVLSAVCTHSGCTVRYAASNADIQCPCHGSSFDLDGNVTNGPADRPLATYTTTFDQAADVVRVMLG